jgi:5'-3' exonuclease
MGIPFYFASLVRNHKGIVKPAGTFDVDVLAIDFNCLIHQYLGPDPIKSILDGLTHILNLCRAKKVYIAFDGLVPYGKIVQQRYRRFRIQESDKNQISPDTPFMRSLESALKAKFPFIIVSTTQEPGEGEHKLFQFLKKLPAEKRDSICIYGLDADLILLSLFNAYLAPTMYLLRESAEFKVSGTEFSVLDIHQLSKNLPMNIEQYLVLCVLCFGNDFMPNLGIFSLREDGYNRALEYYRNSGSPDLKTEEGRARFLDFCETKELTVLKELVKARKQPFEQAVIGKNGPISIKYGLHILDGVTKMEPVVVAFWKTFHWTLYYFQTNEVYNWDWYYPYPEAPLIQDIVQLYESRIHPAELNFKVTNQLQLILPSASLHQARRKVLFADEFYTETREPWLKKFDWEMDPRISIPWHPSLSLTSTCLL